MRLAACIKLYLCSLLLFLIVDGVWLGLVARDFYYQALRNTVDLGMNPVAALAIYLILVAGILIFATLPALQRRRFSYAPIHGALFGLACYATYELTSLAVVRNWPLTLVFVDIAWGSALCALTATAGYALGQFVGRADEGGPTTPATESSGTLRRPQ